MIEMTPQIKFSHFTGRMKRYDIYDINRQTNRTIKIDTYIYIFLEKKYKWHCVLKKMQRIFISILKTHWIIYHEIHSMLSVISVIILNALQVVISSKNKHGCFCPAKRMSQTSLSKLVSKRIQMRRNSCFFFIPATGTFKFGNSLRFNFTE